jgi:hypothetical protein
MEYEEVNIRFFKLNQDGKEYILSLSIYEDCIRLTCQENKGISGNYYETNYTLNELCEINRFFFIMNSLYEAQNELIKAIEKQKIGIELGQNSLNLIFYLIIGTDNILLKLPLAKRDKSYKRVRIPEDQEPFTGDVHLKNKGNYPEDERRIITLEKYNDQLKQSQSALIDGVQNLMDVTEKLKKETSILYEENSKLNTRLKAIQKENFERNLEVDNLKKEEQILNEESIKLKNYNNELEKLLAQKKENLRKTFIESQQNKFRKGEIDYGNGPKAISSRFDNAQIKTFIPRLTAKPKVDAYEESISQMRKSPFYYTDKRRSNFPISNVPTEERFNRTDYNIKDININNPMKNSYSNYSDFNSLNNSEYIFNKSPDDNYKKKAKRKNQPFIQKVERITEKTNDNENEDEMKNIYFQNKNINLSNQDEDASSNFTQSLKDMEELNNKFIKKEEEFDEEELEVEEEFEEESQSINNKYMNSDIVKSPMEESMLLDKLGNHGKTIKLKLLYKASLDSDRAEVFHNKCNKAKSTIVFIETINGNRFGGYTTQSWEGDGIDKKDENAFVFSLDKLQIYNIISQQPAIGCYPKYGPVFLGCQIKVNDNFFVKGGTTYRKNVNYAINSDFELNDGIKFFGIKDLEVFEVNLL